MAATVVMPQMGYDMTQGKIVQWLKHEGDRVEKGEPIAEIETEKVNIQIEAFASGVLSKIVAQEGDSVPVGQPIAMIGEPGEAPEAAPTQQEAPTTEAAAEAAPAQAEGAGEGAESMPTTAEVEEPPRETAEAPRGEVQQAPKETEEAPRGEVREAPRETERTAPDGEATPEEGVEADQGERIKASPVARRLAEEHGVELGRVQGTGPGGRITKEDVESFMTQAAGKQQAGGRRPQTPSAAPGRPEAAPQPAAQGQPQMPSPVSEGVPTQQKELSRMGQAIARRMADSKRSIPHFYATVEVDMSRVVVLREELNRGASDEEKISFNDFVIKACAAALTQFPMINAAFGEGRLAYYQQVNIGMAVAVDDGLVAPVIRDCDKKPLQQIAVESRQLTGRTREGRLRQEDYGGATFTISNMGMLGIDEFAAIITPGQAAILAVGTVAQRPVVRDGMLDIAHTMRATLSVDHRVANGADGARFLTALKQQLEEPGRLLR